MEPTRIQDVQFEALAIILFSPRIAQNVGSIGRLCAAARAPLHIVRPVPFRLDDKSLRRTAMDYWEFLSLTIHTGWPACRAAFAGRRIWLFTTKAERLHTSVEYRAGDALLFGNESHGVPEEVRQELGEDAAVRIPIHEPRARSLNLSQAAAIGLHEAIRQFGIAAGPD
ncbi:tRNA (cytidine(34)-2'-O)-methyltransferase [Candidatus Poribacteria bacterium]|nr:tRNA (cytidine(34)-2'-O)-methyltransferase [Candidatus Poribacteria bacterium]